ncbi:hypothetical protein [Gabonibacter massiliensis]|uniref:golvesin C-terminal-like domain-containing protein n=1 Tax=Gabonibacter massiliensis TaxID=1720195 RepID=UPI00073EF029|nr:hypothetical protein [Gabonibacter massiliensis]
METTALKTAIFYESKLVKRSWLFYLFILGLLGYTSGILIPWDIHRVVWWDIAFASSIPLRGIYFLNLFQSVIVTFIACDIHRKRKKAETREVFSVRPIGNGRSFLGESLGIFIPFLVIDVIFMIICVFINMFMPDSPVNPLVNLFYLLTYVLPTLIFITGLSLIVNRLVKYPFVSWLILLAFLYFAYTYLTTPLHGILDFRGSLLPDSFSTIVGFMHLGDYLLQRGVFLLLGTSFLYFAVLFTKRLPGVPGRRRYFIVPASLFLVIAIGLGFFYIEKFRTRFKNRIEYRAVFLKYDEYPKARVLEHDITYRPMGDNFSATSRMKIQNRKKVTMDRLLLFLNPGLKIDKLESGGQNLSFHRDRQVIVIERPLAPGENIEIEMEYEGCIDEDIYQVNIPDEDFFSPVMYSSRGENYGKRSAFVSGKYTLLLPPLMWYPMAVAPVGLQASSETDFTDYTLHVKKPGDMTVLSQGKPTSEGDKVTFHNLQNLTGLSLCIGKYEKRAITVDSLTVEFYTYPGNDFYLKFLDEWEELEEDNPERERNLTRIFNRCKAIIEEGKPNPYPFHYFKLVEVPVSFLNSVPFSDNIQPEIAFFEERFCTKTHRKPGTLSGRSSRDMSVQEYMLYNDMPYYLDRVNTSHIFTDHNRSITSDRYRGMDLIFNQMIQPEEVRLNITPKILNRIVEKGLEGVITEGYSPEQSIAISLKVSHLLGYLTTITTWDSLTRFTREFSERARFREADFDSFVEEFERRFGQNIKEYMDEWYASRQLPLLSIKDLSCKTTKETQVIDFKVGNFSETEGIVSVITRGWTQSGEETIVNCRGYRIEPGGCKRIVVHENLRYSLKLTTNYSGNLPKNILLNRGESPLSGPVPKEGVIPLDRDQFYPPGEIVVDNEDENFQLIDSANNRKRLADLIKSEDNQEYFFAGCNIKANAWGGPALENGLNKAYGEYIRSAFTKAVGTGQFKAEWTASLPEAGKYEIFIHRPHVETQNIDQYTTDYPGMKNYYTVYTSGGKEEIVLEVQKGDPAWLSLGTFSLPAGASRVVLDDRGVPPIESDGGLKYAQLVVADAVKWVKLK